MSTARSGFDTRLPEFFVLLDDAQTSGAQHVAPNPAGIRSDRTSDGTSSLASSRLYTAFSHERRCTDPLELDTFWQGVNADLERGLFATVKADYEWGVALQRGHAERQPGLKAIAPGLDDTAPVLRVCLFASLQFLTNAEVETFLAAAEAAPSVGGPLPAGIVDLRSDTTPEAFERAIERIHEALRSGDCYQINYTFRLAFEVFGSPVSLYRRLRARQPAAYGALCRFGDRWTLSASPELFITHQNARIVAKPMKGTAPRSRSALDDAAAGQALQNDPKNRAENVMIVDLLRNDLGRVATVGSVTVSNLFEVQAWPTVWQMSSTVEARLQPQTRFPDILRALFPCGSITGAPKRAAIDLIEKLETAPRGLYTGAIGWIEAEGPNCGNFCLSVAIRTLTLDAPGPTGLYPGRLGIGAGIVLDSRSKDEYAECLLKARFLTDADPGFALFETILVAERQAPYLARHLARLEKSAVRLGFPYDATTIHACITQTLAGVSLPGAHRMRLSLAKNGEVTCAAVPLAPISLPISDSGTLTVLLASDHGFAPVRKNDFLLGFKTTHRANYDAAWQMAERLGAFDMIFENEHGTLSEGGRTSVLVKIAGQWYTPPLSDGVLPGVMRSWLMDDPTWALQERTMTLDDLARAEQVMLTNALRGTLSVHLQRPRTAASR